MYIEYGYDRRLKSWCTIVFDENRNQVDCAYDGNIISRDFTIEYFKKEYNTTKVVKIKAY
jgi:hypothetical protein